MNTWRAETDIFTGILWYFVSTSYTWNLDPKKNGKHEPTSQIKTSLRSNNAW